MENFHAVRNLLLFECLGKNQRLYEFADAVLLGFGVGQYLFGEIFVGEAEGAAEGVADEGFGEAAGKVGFALGNPVAQFKIVGESRAVVKGAGGIDFPSLDGLSVSSRLDTIRFGGAPLACGVEVLQTEADGINLAMATCALCQLLNLLFLPLSKTVHLIGLLRSQQSPSFINVYVCRGQFEILLCILVHLLH